MVLKRKNSKPIHISNHHKSQESDWVKRFAHHVPHDSNVLDVACGSGRQGRFFLNKGHQVTFVDKDVTEVGDLVEHPNARMIAGDLEAGPWPLGKKQFQCMVVTNYLWRPNFKRLLLHLDGLLIYETFAEGNEQYGRPQNKDFLLQKGELFERIRGHCQVIAYEQRTLHYPSQAIVQRIAARTF